MGFEWVADDTFFCRSAIQRILSAWWANCVTDRNREITPLAAWFGAFPLSPWKRVKVLLGLLAIGAL